MKSFALRTCAHCRQRYRPKNPKGRFCSDVCRFWANVRVGGPNECWPWKGARTKGYPKMRLNSGKTVLATRFLCEMVRGPLPPNKDATHRCDNPPCCHPGHVRPATKSQNIQEMYDRGRRVGNCGGGHRPKRRGA